MASAKQSGFIQLEGGSLGDTTFVKSKDGNRARTKKSLTNNRWKTDPHFARSRENAQEFGTGSTAASLLSAILHPFLGVDSNKIAFMRLKVLMSKLVLLDSTGIRGKRTIRAENAVHLKGFEINAAASLRSIFNSRFSTAGNRETGEYSITIPSFIPADKIRAPKGTTHLRLVMGASAIDFVKPDCERNTLESDPIPFDSTPTDDLEMTVNLPPNSDRLVFLYLGVKFEQVTQSVSYDVAYNKLNPVRIVDVF